MGAAMTSAKGLDPCTVEEAQARLDWPMWEKVMKKELDALGTANTWTVVPKPSGKNIVRCKWVFHIKKHSAGRIEKYKAQLVAHGFTQVYGVDYTETFVPVAKMASLQTILTTAAQRTGLSKSSISTALFSTENLRKKSTWLFHLAVDLIPASTSPNYSLL